MSTKNTTSTAVEYTGASRVVDLHFFGGDVRVTLSLAPAWVLFRSIRTILVMILRDAGAGRCMNCGAVFASVSGEDDAEALRCAACGGLVEPAFGVDAPSPKPAAPSAEVAELREKLARAQADAEELRTALKVSQDACALLKQRVEPAAVTVRCVYCVGKRTCSTQRMREVSAGAPCDSFRVLFVHRYGEIKEAAQDGTALNTSHRVPITDAALACVRDDCEACKGRCPSYNWAHCHVPVLIPELEGLLVRLDKAEAHKRALERRCARYEKANESLVAESETVRGALWKALGHEGEPGGAHSDVQSLVRAAFAFLGRAGVHKLSCRDCKHLTAQAGLPWCKRHGWRTELDAPVCATTFVEREPKP